MPVASLTCPHCENPVDIQVTTVTRSRPCPQCGKTIMLQVSGRESRLKHKALLVSATPPTDTILKPDFDYDPQMIPGDAFNRMCSDPEVLRARVRFLAGAGSVLGAILLATILRFTGIWTVEPEPVIVSAPPLSAPAQKSTAPETTKIEIKKTAPAPEAITKLSFRPANAKAKSDTGSSEPQRALEKFLAAETVEERLALVVNSPGIEAQMQDYYKQHPVGPVAYDQIESGLKSSESFIEFRVVLNDGTKRFAAVVPTPSGPRVDWPSFVALGDLEWEQMRQTRPTKPVLMRVLAVTASNFTGHFSDAANLRCVQLVPAGNPTAAPIYGYVPKATDLDRDLDYWLRSAGGDMAPLTVKLCYAPDGTGNDQAWITQLVVPGWVAMAANTESE